MVAVGGVDEAAGGRGRSAGRHVDRLVEGERAGGRFGDGEGAIRLSCDPGGRDVVADHPALTGVRGEGDVERAGHVGVSVPGGATVVGLDVSDLELARVVVSLAARCGAVEVI